MAQQNFGEAAARQAAARWGYRPEAELELLCISENATYSVRDPVTGRRTALRLNRPGYHSRTALESELAWTAALRQESVLSTPAALPTENGELVVALGPGRHAVMFSFVEGTAPQDDSLAASMPVLGELTARLHKHAQQWTRPPTFTRFAWDLEAALGSGNSPGRWGDWRAAAAKEGLSLLAAAAGEVTSTLTRYGCAPDRFGLIHADLRAANLLVSAGHTDVTVIDFDDCGLSWYGYDLAASLSFLEHRPGIAELAAGWLEGYRRVRRLGAHDLAALPSLVMLRRLQLLAWSASHSDTDMVRSLGPDFASQTARVAASYLAQELLAGIG